MTDHLKEIIENSTEVRAKLDQMNGEIKKLDEEVGFPCKKKIFAFLGSQYVSNCQRKNASLL